MTSGIVEILIEDIQVQNLVGLNRAGNKYKIYPVVCPQGEEQPYQCVYRGSAGSIPSLTKDIRSELDYPTVTVMSYAKSYRQAEVLAEATRVALERSDYITDAGYQFNSIWLVQERDLFDDSSQLYAIEQQFQCELKRVIPT